MKVSKKLSKRVFYILFISNLILYTVVTYRLLRGDFAFSNSVSGSKTIAASTVPVTKLAQIGIRPIIDPPKHNDFPWGQCTWYVATKRNVTWDGNARNWYFNAQAAGREVGSKARVGSIVVMDAGYYGHVGYVEAINGDKFTFSEMNHAGLGVKTTRTFSQYDLSIIGYIY